MTTKLEVAKNWLNEHKRSWSAHDLYSLIRLIEARPVAPGLREMLELVEQQIGWHGDGERAHDEYYCEHCKSEPAPDSKDIQHLPDCLVLKVRAALTGSAGASSEPPSAELKKAQAALEHDRTKVAECVTAVKKALHNYDWLITSRGSYEWNDDRWHEEFKRASETIWDAIEPMVRIAADWSNCPKTQAEIDAARLAVREEPASSETPASRDKNGWVYDPDTELKRIRFEAWLRQRHPYNTDIYLKRTSKSGAYDKAWVNTSWLAWRAALAPAPAASDEHLSGRLAARLDEYNFIAQMVAGVEKEDWYKRRVEHLESLYVAAGKESK